MIERDANWIENWAVSIPNVTWNAILKEFIDHFKNVNTKSDWLQKLQKMEMTTSVQDYTDEILDLMHKLKWDT